MVRVDNAAAVDTGTMVATPRTTGDAGTGGGRGGGGSGGGGTGGGSGGGADSKPAFMQYYNLSTKPAAAAADAPAAAAASAAPETASAFASASASASAGMLPMGSPPAGNPAFRHTSTLLGAIDVRVPADRYSSPPPDMPLDVDFYAVDNASLDLPLEDLRKRRSWLETRYRMDLAELTTRYEAAGRAMDDTIAALATNVDRRL